MGHGKSAKNTVDYRFPHKTPYKIVFENDALLLLQDLDDDDAAYIFESADWVIESLRIYRGVLTKRVFFNDVMEGLLELTHDGNEFEKTIRPTASQTTYINNILKGL